MRTKHSILAVSLLACSTFASAQSYTDLVSKYEKTPQIAECGYFNHMDLSFTAGSTGLGLDIAMPVGDYVQLRAGGAFMPHFHYNMKFNVQVGDDPSTSASKFEKLSGMLNEMTGNEVRDHVVMQGTPKFNNFKFLVDVLPLHNKNFHVTAGFYVGPSTVATAVNSTEDMTSLMAVSIYNNMYQKIASAESKGEEPWEEVEFFGYSLPYDDANLIANKFLSYGKMGMPEGTFTHDMTLLDGREVKEGDQYVIFPDKDNMVKVNMKANKFKPYLGVGYGGPISKDKKYSLSFDCGVMLWGGTTKLLTEDGVDLQRDVKILDTSQIKPYVDAMHHLKIYPVLDLRITRKIF